MGMRPWKPANWMILHGIGNPSSGMYDKESGLVTCDPSPQTLQLGKKVFAVGKDVCGAVVGNEVVLKDGI